MLLLHAFESHSAGVSESRVFGPCALGSCVCSFFWSLSHARVSRAAVDRVKAVETVEHNAESRFTLAAGVPTGIKSKKR
jgi:hypothetical protein